MISEYDFLTENECEHTRDTVMNLKEYWINRANNLFPFYTLGAASYLDTNKEDSSSYYQSVSRYNPILENHFSSIYEKLREKLSEIFHMPIIYDTSQALPGFHIFLANKFFENTIASTHFDLQFKPLKWDYQQIDYENPISFTCPVALPYSPAGIYYWNITKKDAKGLSHGELEKLKNSKEKLFFPYSKGKLVLHRGLILHQIAPCKEIKPTDERITLQGHGLVCDGKMRIYW